MLQLVARANESVYQSSPHAHLEVSLDVLNIGRQNLLRTDLLHPGGDAMGFQVELPGEQPAVSLVVVPGTSALSDLLGQTDVTLFGQAENEHRPQSCSVHAGFLSRANDLWPRVKTFVQTSLEGSGDLIFTGHSDGAAVATLLAALYEADRVTMPEDPRRVQLVTFGSPRVGTHAFADLMNTIVGLSCFQVVNHQDLVTRLPRRRHGFWHHEQTLVMFDQNGRVALDPLAFQEFIDGLPMPDTDEIAHALVGGETHEMSTYRQLISTALSV